MRTSLASQKMSPPLRSAGGLGRGRRYTTWRASSTWQKMFPPSRHKLPLPLGESRVRETSSDVRSGGGLGRGQTHEPLRSSTFLLGLRWQRRAHRLRDLADVAALDADLAQQLID